MDNAAQEGLRRKLYANARELMERLDRNIEELARLTPSGHSETIGELKSTMITIRHAVTSREES